MNRYKIVIELNAESSHDAFDMVSDVKGVIVSIDKFIDENGEMMVDLAKKYGYFDTEGNPVKEEDFKGDLR